MKSDVALRVENLGKRYKLGLTHAGSIRGLVNSWTQKLGLSKKDSNQEISHSGAEPQSQCDEQGDFWALKDISFEVPRGEVVGIIGANGSGKSTLLKILSRITHPTTGKADIFGRVGALLEVGTGFHQELTGRENVFLNGAILGMTRAEVKRKFDEIIDFSGVSQFIDTPVKRYSSGMKVRLGFAVAAHLEPEILIIDEVLAVGDVEFQKRCLGKMGDVARSGRTILFVSHNMGAVKSICSRAILLEKGKMIADSDSGEAVDAYLQQGVGAQENGIIPDDANRIGIGGARVRSVTLLNLDEKEVSELFLGQTFKVRLKFEVFNQIPDALFEISISTFDGIQLCVGHNEHTHQPVELTPGFYSIEAAFQVELLPRHYTFDVGIYHENGVSIDYVERSLDFEVLRVREEKEGYYRWPQVRGYVHPKSDWQPPFPINNSVTTDAISLTGTGEY